MVSCGTSLIALQVCLLVQAAWDVILPCLHATSVLALFALGCAGAANDCNPNEDNSLMPILGHAQASMCGRAGLCPGPLGM